MIDKKRLLSLASLELTRSRFRYLRTKESNTNQGEKNMNENLKLVSARIEPRTLENIEKFCKNHRYWKRNAVINGILTAVFDHFEDGDIYDMVRTWQVNKDQVDCKYKIVK